MNDTKLENFEQAFGMRMGTCRFDCHCGKTYFDDANEGYSWEDGELEKLRAGGGIPMPGSIGGVEIEGWQFAECCTCWHPRAKQIMHFIETHGHQIAEWLTLEKKRKQANADASPGVG